jgi:hypothetical protein
MGSDARQSQYLPASHRDARQQRNPVQRVIGYLLIGRRDPERSRRPVEGGDEPVIDRVHRLCGDGGDVHPMRPRLVVVNLLQPEDVGTDGLDRRGQPIQVHLPVG